MESDSPIICLARALKHLAPMDASEESKRRQTVAVQDEDEAVRGKAGLQAIDDIEQAIASIPARTLPEAAIQVQIAGRYTVRLTSDADDRRAQRVVARVYALLRSALPVIAEAASGEISPRQDDPNPHVQVHPATATVEAVGAGGPSSLRRQTSPEWGAGQRVNPELHMEGADLKRAPRLQNLQRDLMIGPFSASLSPRAREQHKAASERPRRIYAAADRRVRIRNARCRTRCTTSSPIWTL